MADFLLASRRSDNLRLCYRNCSLTCNHRSNRLLVMENMMQYVQCYLRPYRITVLFFHSLPLSSPAHLYLHTLQIAIPLYCRENQFRLLLTAPSCERFSKNAWISVSLSTTLLNGSEHETVFVDVPLFVRCWNFSSILTRTFFSSFILSVRGDFRRPINITKGSNSKRQMFREIIK